MNSRMQDFLRSKVDSTELVSVVLREILTFRKSFCFVVSVDALWMQICGNLSCRVHNELWKMNFRCPDSESEFDRHGASPAHWHYILRTRITTLWFIKLNGEVGEVQFIVQAGKRRREDGCRYSFFSWLNRVESPIKLKSFDCQQKRIYKSVNLPGPHSKSV